jgi:hexosaminidase
VIFKEIAGLFPSKYIHIGGDEVNPYFWDHCSRCQALMKKENMNSAVELQHYFIHRVETILHSLGKRMAGWDEIMDGGSLDTTTTVYAWHSTEKAAEAATKHYPTVLVMGSYFYFDMAQSINDRGHDWAGIVPLEKVYSFNPLEDNLFPDKSFHYVKGVQGALWSELLNKPPRFLEYQSYPRIVALAEVGWTPQSERNWNDFNTRLTRTHFQRMEYMNIAFRVPPPEAFYRSGFVSVVPPFEGAVIHYTTDAGLPVEQSPVYRDSIRTNMPDSLRFRTFYSQSLASIAITPIRVPIGTWNVRGQSAVIQNTWNLAPVFNQAGSWDITFTPDSLNNAFCIEQVTLLENGYTVASAHIQYVVDGNWHYRLEVPAYDATKVYSIRAEIKTASPSGGSVQMQLLPYLTPTTGVIVNMPLENHNTLSLTDYNFSTTVSCRGNAKAGDALTFVFASPLTCKRITSVTGMPMLSLFPIKHGHLEVSYDGIRFEYVSAYQDGSASIEPVHPVKAVRIVIDAPTEDPMMVIQDLRIE